MSELSSALMRAGAVVVLMCAMLALRGGVARAQAPDEMQRTSLYNEGLALMEKGQWREAADRFRQVVAIRSAPPPLFMLGQAEEKQDHLATAEGAYDRALADARASGNPRVAQEAERALASLYSRVPRVIIKLTRAWDRAAASVDGRTAPLDAPVKVDAGDHAIEVRAPGAKRFATNVHVSDRQALDVPVTLETDPDAASPPAVPTAAPTTAPTPGSTSRPDTTLAPAPPSPLGPALVGGAGVVVAIAGFVVRANGSSDYDRTDATCPNKACASADAADAGNSARDRMILGTVLMVAGGAAVAAAGLWWALSRSSASSVGVRVAPILGGGASAGIAGTF